MKETANCNTVTNDADAVVVWLHGRMRSLTNWFTRRLYCFQDVFGWIRSRSPVEDIEIHILYNMKYGHETYSYIHCGA